MGGYEEGAHDGEWWHMGCLDRCMDAREGVISSVKVRTITRLSASISIPG